MNNLHLAEEALQRSLPELMELVDEIDVDLPSFLSLNNDDEIEANRTLKIRALWAKSQEKICKSEPVRNLFNDTRSEARAMLVCAIADYFTIKGAITISAIFVKEGLHFLCAAHWTKDEKSNSQ